MPAPLATADLELQDAPPFAAPRPGRARRRLPVWPVTAVLAAIWFVIDPPTPDLVAHLYRADIVSRAGLTTWDQGWYGGHHLPSYSVFMPLASALLTPQLAAALCAVAATWLFGRLAALHWRPEDDPPAAAVDAATAATLAVAVAVVSALCGGQLAFVCGLVPGLAALLLARQGHLGWAAVLGVATTLTSPVVASFLTLACAAWWVAKRQWAPIVCASGAVVCGLLLLLAFPEGGEQPISTTALWEAVAVAVACVIVVPSTDRALRWGAGLYALALIVSELVDNPLGGNLIRLSAVFGLPLVVGALWRDRRIVLALLVLPLLAWQWNVPVSSMIQDAGDPSADAAYHAPLIAELDRLEHAHGPFRTEIPFTRDHWETRYVAPTHPIARGWERQLDIKRNRLFYYGAMTQERYRAWLDEQGVRYVALPDVPLDSSSIAEGALVRSGLPYLRPIWHNAHWKLYAVLRPTALATGGATLTAMDLDSLTLHAAQPNSTTVVRVHWSPYLAVAGAPGCVSPVPAPDPGDWTLVRLRNAGTARVVVRLSVLRIRARSERCTS